MPGTGTGGKSRIGAAMKIEKGSYPPMPVETRLPQSLKPCWT